jgi:hypothetical protein
MPLGRGLRNPSGVARIIMRLESLLNDHGLVVRESSDMAAFAQLKQATRNMAPGPMHDPAVCDFSGQRAFWMGLFDGSGACVGMQAFRCDQVEVSLAEWCANYMIGIYMRRGELMVPSHAHAPSGSVAERLKGSLVYHGELWIDPQVKTQNAVDLFTRLGSYLALIKWQPDAIWALTKQRLAARGMMGRFNFSIVERGFLRWKIASDGIDPVEYLAVAERAYLEQAVEEDLTSGPFDCPTAVPEQVSGNLQAFSLKSL